MFIFSNLAISLDGKIATQSREHFPLGTKEDLKQMLVLRKQSDAILFGASTLRAYQKPCKVKDASPPIYNIIVSQGCESINPQWPFFTSNEIRRILFHSKDVDPSLKKELEKSSTLIRVDNSKPMGTQIVELLKKFEINRLLVEGGGEVIWYFSQENLIDEYNVTITPRILGGKNAPTLVEGLGFKPDDVLNLKLKSCKTINNEIFIVYSKTGSKGRILPE